MTKVNDILRFPRTDLKLMVGRNSLAKLLCREPKASRRSLRIVTYSLPSIHDLEDLRTRLQPRRIKIIAHTKFSAQAQQLTKKIPDLQIVLHPAVHSKVVLIKPNIVIVGSANLGGIDLHETCVLMHSSKVYEGVAREWKKLWNESQELKQVPKLSGFFDQ
jgi:phosphatidylserine/phosphatidylglycerophosphate/cardiolipin synthase-like enzyme